MTRVSRSSSMDGADIPVRKRSMSMEEADKPLGIYYLLFQNTFNILV